jgi:hypothetical protein
MNDNTQCSNEEVEQYNYEENEEQYEEEEEVTIDSLSKQALLAIEEARKQRSTASTSSVKVKPLPHYFHVSSSEESTEPGYHFTKIHIYDFDGTLFETPLPQHGIPLYERVTGRRFPVIGHWWATEHSLDCSVFDIEAGQAYNDYFKSAASTDVITLMMTGRNMAIRNAVLNILNNHSMKFSYSIFKPDEFPSSTLVYKTRAIQELITRFENLEEIVMWEDRKEHATAFRDLNNKFTNSSGVRIKIKVNLVRSATERTNFGFRRGQQMSRRGGGNSRGGGGGGYRGRGGDDYRPKSYSSRGGKIFTNDHNNNNKRNNNSRNNYYNNSDEQEDTSEIYTYKSKLSSNTNRKGKKK